MISAKEARAATNERLVVMAKEFIINNTGISIQDAINNGHFSTQVSFKEVPNPEKVGAEVVRQLEEQGYKAEHVYYEGYTDYDSYILISWGDD